MSYYKIKSYAKINLSLGVIKKLNSNYHKIESIVSFIDLHDEIFIKKINNKYHKIFFYGKFKKKINQKNTISKLLKILDERKKLKDQKYFIKIKKNIPNKSGLGGGSMNASSVLMYFFKQSKIKISNKETIEISNKVGSDVTLGLRKKNSALFSNGKLSRYNNKLGLYTLLIKPNFGCSTKLIYKKINSYSRPHLIKNNQNKLFKINFIKNLSNDLEKYAFKTYPNLLFLKKFMLNLPKVLFVRMTGSGSTMIAYFLSKKTCFQAAKILKKKYKNYWCIISKTI